MVAMDDFSIDQLMLFIGGVLGSLGALLLVVQKSKCKEVDCCCIKCVRDTDAIVAEKKLELGKLPTPRPAPTIPTINNEPEPEDLP